MIHFNDPHSVFTNVAVPAALWTHVNRFQLPESRALEKLQREDFSWKTPVYLLCVYRKPGCWGFFFIFHHFLFVWLYPVKQQQINGRWNLSSRTCYMYRQTSLCSPTAVRTSGVRRRFLCFINIILQRNLQKWLNFLSVSSLCCTVVGVLVAEPLQ